MNDKPVLWETDDRGVATLTLNRPERNNAYNSNLINSLHQAMDELSSLAGLRALIIKGNGRHFQAGADLIWINEVRVGSRSENIAASRATAEAIDRLNRLTLPTVALVHGFCVGGGTGLIAACDIVIAAEDAKFAISEVRWGLTASIIFPQLNDAISVRQLRRYGLTGERFGAAEARRIGLVHEVVPGAELTAAGNRIVDALLENAPVAIAETKHLALAHAFGDVSAGTLLSLVENHAAKRQSDEAEEGLASFAEKRPARW
ncbi:MAG: enoyl-CoA hydratase-related protein [Hyphomicrobiaceae bacterium]